MESAHKLRLMLSTNAPWATSGYAVQAEMLSSRIHAEGYNLALSNYYGQEGGVIKVNDIIMYPKIGSLWGDDAMYHHTKDFKADISFTLQDIWTLNPDLLRLLPRWIPIVPIDHDPVAVGIVERLRLAYRIVTYSKFGQKQLEKQGMYSTYIPHGVDTTIFKPLGNKEELRKKINIPPDIFLFGMVSANKDNPSRKSLQEAIDAFAIFHKKNPKSGMYFHSLLQQQGGFPIDTYWNFVGLPKDKIFYIEPYDLMFHVGRVEMAQIMNCFDCLLIPSTNEGFGVPAVEAQACGVPVIVNDFTAMPELIKEGETGYKCAISQKRFTPLLSYVGVPDINSLADCMFRVYNKDRVKMGELARKWAVQEYDMEMIYKTKWSPFLKRLEEEVYPEN